MIKQKQMEKLKASWGVIAESMDCKAEVRVYDPLSLWECYIYSMNPDNEDEIMCLISGGKNLEPIITQWKLSELSYLYNADGEGVEIDEEYRPRHIAEILKRLNGNRY